MVLAKCPIASLRSRRDAEAEEGVEDEVTHGARNEMPEADQPYERPRKCNGSAAARNPARDPARSGLGRQLERPPPGVPLGHAGGDEPRIHDGHGHTEGPQPASQRLTPGGKP